MSWYHRILVALDGSPDAEAALEHAVSLARDQNALLTLLSVAPAPSTPIGAGASAPPDLLEANGRVLREATSSLPADVGVRTRLERGNPAEVILQVGAEDRPRPDRDGLPRPQPRPPRAAAARSPSGMLNASPVPVLLIRAGAGVERDPSPGRKATSSAV